MTAVPTSERATRHPAQRFAPPPPDRATPPSPAAARDVAAPTNALVAGYLAATTLPLALAVAGGRTTAPRLAAHVAFLALTLCGARARWSPGTSGVVRGALRTILAWVPLLLIPALYVELPHVAAGLGGRMHDAAVIGWERALFGDSPARTLAGRLPWAWLSETLHAGYLSYYALIVGPPLLLFAAGRRRAFAESAFTVMLTFVACYAVFVLFPVQGPWFEWPAPAVPRGPVRLAVENLLHAGSSRGTAFPSSHVAVSLAQTVVMLRLWRPVGAVCGACTAALALGAVYGGLHYGIDVVVGAAVGAALGGLGPALFRRLTPRG